MDISFHKGETCVHRLILCQEGYCSDCAIHLVESKDWGWKAAITMANNPLHHKALPVLVPVGTGEPRFDNRQ